MKSAWELIESALNSLKDGIDAAEGLIDNEDTPQQLEVLNVIHGHLEDAYSELEKAKAMIY